MVTIRVEAEHVSQEVLVLFIYIANMTFLLGLLGYEAFEIHWGDYFVHVNT